MLYHTALGDCVECDARMLTVALEVLVIVTEPTLRAGSAHALVHTKHNEHTAVIMHVVDRVHL
jgi:hypothetical protein